MTIVLLRSQVCTYIYEQLTQISGHCLQTVMPFIQLLTIPKGGHQVGTLALILTNDGLGVAAKKTMWRPGGGKPLPNPLT